MKPVSLVLLLALSALVGCAGHSSVTRTDPGAQTVLEEQSTLIGQWGIEAQSLRLSGDDYLLDFRYKVVDPAKAKLVVNKKDSPYLIHEATGAQVGVPSSEQIGALRHTGGNLKPNTSYFVLFANPGRYIKRGDRVTLVMGKYRIEHLVVE